MSQDYRKSVLQAEKEMEAALGALPERHRFGEDWYAEALASAEKKFEAAVQNRLELCEGTLTTKVCEWARLELAAVRAEMQAARQGHERVTGNYTRPDGYE